MFGYNKINTNFLPQELDKIEFGGKVFQTFISVQLIMLKHY